MKKFDLIRGYRKARFAKESGRSLKKGWHHL